jgi:phosphatidate cytidylyltransferase
MQMLSSLHPNVLYTICGLFAALVVASFAVWYLKRTNPESNYQELELRVRSWWMMIAVFSLAMIINRKVSIVFFALISFLAFKEYLTMIPTRRADHRVLLWAYLAIPIQYLWVAIEWYGMFIIFIPVYVFLFLPMRMILIGETDGFVKAVGTLHWGIMLTVYCISHVAYLLVMPAREGFLPGGTALVLFLVILTQANDVAQYMWGKSFGKNKIIPKVSPNKTVEGFLGGLSTITVLAVLLSPLLTPMSLFHSAIAGILIASAGFVGDVTVSALKRDLQLKDSGSLLPGHGGIMDRVDSLTYTAPLFFHFIHYLYY